ncbi:hypothetical protein KUA42_12895 [Prevotella copri]|nr:hypothetical protein [Segatella copri]
MCNTDVSLSSSNGDKLKDLGFGMTQDDKMPAVVLY